MNLNEYKDAKIWDSRAKTMNYTTNKSVFAIIGRVELPYKLDIWTVFKLTLEADRMGLILAWFFNHDNIFKVTLRVSDFILQLNASKYNIKFQK